MRPHRAFNPEQYTLCYRAYASALHDIRCHKDASGGAPPSDDTCLAVALRIIEASANGVRDISNLKQFGLADMIGRRTL